MRTYHEVLFPKLCCTSICKHSALLHGETSTLFQGGSRLFYQDSPSFRSWRLPLSMQFRCSPSKTDSWRRADRWELSPPGRRLTFSHRTLGRIPHQTICRTVADDLWHPRACAWNSRSSHSELVGRQAAYRSALVQLSQLESPIRSPMKLLEGCCLDLSVKRFSSHCGRCVTRPRPRHLSLGSKHAEDSSPSLFESMLSWPS